MKKLFVTLSILTGLLASNHSYGNSNEPSIFYATHKVQYWNVHLVNDHSKASVAMDAIKKGLTKCQKAGYKLCAFLGSRTKTDGYYGNTYILEVQVTVGAIDDLDVMIQESYTSHALWEDKAYTKENEQIVKRYAFHYGYQDCRRAGNDFCVPMSYNDVSYRYKNFNAEVTFFGYKK